MFEIRNSRIFKKLFVNYLVPMNRTLGIKLRAMEDDGTVMTMKGRRKITNYGGTIHGGAIMALAETVHGGAVLNKIGAFENLMVTKNCSLKFLKRGRGDLKVRFKLDAESEAYIKDHLEQEGKCEIELVSAVADSTGDTVAELTALYCIKRLGKKPGIGKRPQGTASAALVRLRRVTGHLKYESVRLRPRSRHLRHPANAYRERV